MDPAVPSWARLPMRLFRRFQRRPGAPDANETRIRRRRAVIALFTRRLPWLKLALFCIGYLWMIATPLPYLGRRTYIDENALQPGQANTFWGWGEVHAADKYLAKLEVLRDSNSTSQERAQFIMEEFNQLGISASTQKYSFSTSLGVTRGINAYGLLSSPRAPGTEAMVISASWMSRTGEGDGTLNLRGVSTVLALAGFLKRYSHWAKDIVFVIGDNHLDGMHAWLAAYHGSSQTNLQADRLDLPSGVIWTALNIDYPGHSFSHLGIFFEGINGRLPNQDLLNSFQYITRYSVPVVVYDHLDAREHPDRPELSNIPSWVPDMISKRPDVQAYAYQARNIVRHFGYQARGRPSGVHGLFHQFRIDAITIFAVPATGPHGFHAIGRVIESTLRTTNNLLERLHASFFFYILTGPERFLKIGSYLPSAVLISVAMMFGGLQGWTDAGWALGESGNLQKKKEDPRPAHTMEWRKVPRPIIKALGIMVMTHVLGSTLFTLITTSWFSENQMIASPLIFALFTIAPLTVLLIPSQRHVLKPYSLAALLKALNLCLASTVISIMALLNFSLAALLAILLGIPLSISSPQGSLRVRIAKYTAYAFLGLGWLLIGQGETLKAVSDWEILSVWFAPFICLVYVPLVLQAGLVCFLQV